MQNADIGGSGWPYPGYPSDYIIADHDGVPQMIPALERILSDRGVDPAEIADWIRDCGETLKAGVSQPPGIC